MDKYKCATASNVSDAGARVDASQCKGNHLPQSLFCLSV